MRRGPLRYCALTLGFVAAAMTSAIIAVAPDDLPLYSGRIDFPGVEKVEVRRSAHQEGKNISENISDVSNISNISQDRLTISVFYENGGKIIIYDHNANYQIDDGDTALISRRTVYSHHDLERILAKVQMKMD
ncbi:hypothetical protein COV20_01240 [Candidatus Woesearchaeota archaeon CG10_big_fil_rev_8_21_14_0_10_45_16]|nr:MAG: hypothetical protein COV20_01240 [Candidatus Woesearchaeota archaeon CG10_big_fil_rev_8_21_14_0_10_45_16]